MSTTTHWASGDQIVVRQVFRGIVRAAVPVIVVQDTADLVATYLRVGTRYKQRAGPLWCIEDWQLGDQVWERNDVLALVTPGAAHGVWAMWHHGDRSFNCWYVNLQEPYRRTSMGFDTMDQELDIVVKADRSEWRWKDEEAFSKLHAMGVFSAEEARAIRAEGEGVLESMRNAQPTFSSGWENWAPPPGWPIPELPEGWDAVL